MAYSYKGTRITGTSTTAKVFSKSGISNARTNQTYFNTSTGHVYTCTAGGKAKDAKWKYTRTDICAKPTVAVTKLGAPVRGSGHTMTATWAVPGDLTNNKNGKRATGMDIVWYLGLSGTDPKSVKHTGNERLTSTSINLDNLAIGNTRYTRGSFYPFTSRLLYYASVKITPDNSKGNGPSAQNTRYFTAPRAPSISAITLDPATGHLTCTISTDPGNDYQERYDTRYKVIIKNTHTDTTQVISDTSSTSTSIPINYDATGYQALDYGEYIQMTVEAWARGYAGDSGHVYATHYVGFPNIPTILNTTISSKDSAGKCTLAISTNETREHPVDVVTLEYLADVSYKKESEIPGSTSWETSGIVDDGQCTALTIPVANLIPSIGKYTWVRLRSWHDNETVLYRYSSFLRLDDLTTPAPTAADDDITIIDAVAGGDGESAVVTLGWNKDGTDDSTGTELTWSDEEDCWKSTEDPKKYDFTWSDGPITVGADIYNDSAVITIKGLEDATKYYIRARRYLEGDPTTYSDYSNTATCLTSELPESIVATCDRYVPTGESLAVYWTFAGNGIQREWQIVQDVWYELSTDDAVNVDKAYFELTGGVYVRVTPVGTEDPSSEGWYEQLGGAVIATGQNSLGSTQIGADRLATFAVNGSVSFNVQASTGSGFVVSEIKTVTIIEKPVINITGSSLVHVHEESERNFSGDIVTFEPKEDEFVKSLKVPLEPVQDLHGYSSPWVGGAGKNKWSLLNSYTSTGATTIITNEAFSLPSGTYTMSFGGTVSGAVAVTFRKADLTNITQITLSSSDLVGGRYVKTFTATDNVEKINVYVNNSVSISDIQIESGSSATSYEPWENLCPITGWTGCEVEQTGNNLLKTTLTSQTSFGLTFSGNADGSISIQGTSTGTYPQAVVWNKYKDPYPKNTDVTLSVTTTGSIPTGVKVYAIAYERDTPNGANVESHSTKSSGTSTFQITHDYVIVTLVAEGNDLTYTDTKAYCQIELGSTASDYKAYSGTTYNITWQTEAGTVYGGKLHIAIVDGEPKTWVTVDRKYDQMTYAFLSSLTSGYIGYSANIPQVGGNAVWVRNWNYADYPANIDGGIKAVCNAFPISMHNKSLSSSQYRTYFGVGSMTTVEEFLVAVQSLETGGGGLWIAHELQTPTTYQLDPVQVALLLDQQNNIWNNIGDTELTLSRVVLDEDQLQSNNLSFTLGSDSVCDVKVLVTSQGAVGQFPQGVLRQTAGDTIYSNVYEPEWSWDNSLNKWATTIALPTGLDFWDLGNYTLSVIGIDRATSLNSNEILWEFAVAWAHQAPDPFDFVTLTPIDTVDDNDYHHQSVQIYLTPPTGSDTSDVYDIYRLNGDGAKLIGQSFPLTYVAMDDYAPFGDDLTLYYRVAIRTADGDVEFADIEYVQDGSKIRFDWAAGTLELPYNLSVGDKYKKSMTTREHMDGGIDGYWNNNITRTASLNSDVICLNMQDEIDAARQLAHYAGPVFVRTPDGSAYEADVQVSDMSTDGTLTKIAIDATEIDLTQEFILPTPFDLESE